MYVFLAKIELLHSNGPWLPQQQGKQELYVVNINQRYHTTLFQYKIIYNQIFVNAANIGPLKWIFSSISEHGYQLEVSCLTGYGRYQKLSILWETTTMLKHFLIGNHFFLRLSITIILRETVQPNNHKLFVTKVLKRQNLNQLFSKDMIGIHSACLDHPLK